MSWGALALQASYFAVLSLLALYGLHRLALVVVYLRRRPGDPAPPLSPAPGWPAVTVQLPLYNERGVARRLIEAACRLRYPDGLVEIQVLDDSTDETREIVAQCVAWYRSRGHDIQHLHRSSREGYKAGALAHGLRTARGSLIAVFDADFVPPEDFLLRCVPHFVADRGGRVGLVQARWAHLNEERSWLTRAQAMLLDGHFVVEHGARHAAGRFFNFNGTAGVFRRACIEEAGGWQADTLTEDLDLSYRAQLAGWTFEYLDDVVVPAELPEQIGALKSQQRRWAKGSIQTAIKILPRIARAPLASPVKLEAIVHLTNNVAYLLTAALALLIVPALRGRADVPWTYLALDLPLFAAGTGSFALFCGVARSHLGHGWIRTIATLPALMAIGIGLCLNNAAAVIEALAGRSSAFHRTPKRGAYKAPLSPILAAEACCAVFFVTALAAEIAAGRWTSLPFIALFAGGFVHVAALTAGQEIMALRDRALRRAAASPAA